MKDIKRFISISLIIMFLFMLIGCSSNTTNENSSETGNENSGVFTGEAEGKKGTIKAEVTIENGEIKDIEFVENNESEFTETVFEQLPQNIISANSTEVDVITGATVTSTAIIEAVSEAVEKSGIALSAKNSSNENNVKVEDVSTDIVIIGAGGAGLTAAIEATEQGAKVIVVEKNSFMGGNTNYATGGLNAAGTKYQKAEGLEDTPEIFFQDTMEGGHNLNDPELVKILTEESAEVIDWLETFGANLSKISRSGGQSVDRVHTTEDGSPVGEYLVEVFKDTIEDLGIEVRLNTKAIEILAEGNKATGIKVENSDGSQYNINAKAVIIASGGFGANQELVAKYNEELKDFSTTNQPGATGDAFGMVEKLDVALVDMEQIQIHPTAVGNELITEGVRGEGAILVNRNAERFINELETRDTVSKAILSQEGKSAFLVFDDAVVGRLAAIEKYKAAGLLTEANSIEELAQAIGIDGDTLQNTINTYNGYFESQEDLEFGRRVIAGELITSPFYAVEVSPAIHHTMGGIKINTNTEVINNSGEIVEGLFAAGEVVGGVHGGNRLGGNAVTDIVVFGKIAGQNAAEYVN